MCTEHYPFNKEVTLIYNFKTLSKIGMKINFHQREKINKIDNEQVTMKINSLKKIYKIDKTLTRLIRAGGREDAHYQCHK